MNRLRKILSSLPPMLLSALCFVAILWLTLSPDPTKDIEIPLFPGADKIVHAIMFGGQTLCLCLDFRRRNFMQPVSTVKMIFATCFSIAFGIVIEFLQLSMQLGRGFETSDMIADACGAIVFALTWRFWLEKKL